VDVKRSLWRLSDNFVQHLPWNFLWLSFWSFFFLI
jgi:hypothetical protein